MSTQTAKRAGGHSPGHGAVGRAGEGGRADTGGAGVRGPAV